MKGVVRCEHPLHLPKGLCVTTCAGGRLLHGGCPRVFLPLMRKRRHQYGLKQNSGAVSCVSRRAFLLSTHEYTFTVHVVSSRRMTVIDELSEIRRIKEEVEAELLALPGITAVDIGVKYVGGKPTDVTAIRVYVRKKQDVPPEQTIPAEIQGVATDVIERTFVLHVTRGPVRTSRPAGKVRVSASRGGERWCP